MRAWPVALLLSACQSLPHLPDARLQQLKAGAYLTGAPVGLHPARILNDTDFVYDVKWAADSHHLALSRLGMKSFDLLVWANAQPPQQVSQAPVNRHEFDVESVAFSPDGRWAAAVSRDGSVRAFEAATGKAVGGWLADEPLSTVAFHPTLGALAVGSEKGTVTLLKVEAQQGGLKFRFAAEAPLHRGQVRGLAFAADGTLFTAGWDKTVAVLATREQPSGANSAAVKYERKGGFAQVRGTLNDVASVLFALDVRMPQALVLRSALAQAIGLDPSALTEAVPVTSSFGTQVARVARGLTLAFKGLELRGVDAVICDACIPADAQAVLGQGFVDAVELAFDETRGQALLKRKVALPGDGAPLPTISLLRRFTFPAFINDLSVNAAGTVLALAFSETKGERTREVYVREKRDELEPERAWDVAARVDALTGAVLQTYRGHRGVVATAAVSPDGLTLASGGWDKKVLLHRTGKPPVTEKFGWALRRLRFSPDGRWLAAAAWTPQNPLGDGRSARSAVVWEVAWSAAEVVAP